jgi:hypothetical protein
VASSTKSRCSSITIDTSLSLSPAEAEVLALETSVFARAISDAAARARYERLSVEASQGAVRGDLVGAIETMLELVFEKGRPSNRAVLQAIYAKTPRGRQQSSAAREVNRALETLRGQTLADLHISAAPACHTLVIETQQCRLTLEIGGDGARIASLETG